MDGVVCSECGSPHAYPPQPALCHTPFCRGRMGGSDEYVPSRIEATRNMSQPKTTVPVAGLGVSVTVPLDNAPDVAERRQSDTGRVVRPETNAMPGVRIDSMEIPLDPRKMMTVRGTEGAPKMHGERSPHQDVLLTLPAGAAERKRIPVCTGLLDYFPAACAEVAHLSLKGNDQHNPGEPLHWARGKSTDQADTIVRHLMQRGTLDSDGVRHSAKVAWRALALLQEEIEAEAGFVPGADG